MFKCVSLFVWPNKANYSLISQRFHLLCQQLKNPSNDNPILERAYLHNGWSKSHDLNTIRKPRRSTLFDFPNAKRDLHAVKRYTPPSPKTPNIGRVSEPTVNCVFSYPLFFSSFLSYLIILWGGFCTHCVFLGFSVSAQLGQFKWVLFSPSCKGVHNTCTSWARQFCTTVAVPVPFQACGSHLDEWWTEWSRPVQDHHCMSITAVKMVGQVSLTFSG